MKTLLTVPLFALSLTVMATDINLKPGLYETTTDIFLDGKKFDPIADLEKQIQANPAMKQMFEKMSPADKAKMMEGLKGSTQAGYNQSKHCLKKEDLNPQKIIQSFNEENCKYTVTRANANEFYGNVACADGNKGATTFKTNGNEKYSFEFNGTFNGRANAKLVSDGKFVSATCPKGTINE